MKFGLFSNDRRPKRPLGEAWDLDTAEIVVGDELGFSEAWVSEHQSSADLIIARASAMTKRINLASAVRILPIYHPLQVANDAAACDQLTHGRYILGVGPGFSPHKLTQRGISKDDARIRMAESLEVLMRLLRDKTPATIDGKFFKGENSFIELDFVQKPHVPVAISVSNSPDSALTAGRLGVWMITSDFMSAQKFRMLADALNEGQAAAGRPVDRSVARACRVVYVGGTDKEARDDMRASYTEVIKWEIVNTPWHQTARIPPGGTLEDITFDYLVDTGNLFVGSAETVRQMIERHFVETGGYGTLNFHCGRDYATPQKIEQSLRRFMADVVPRVSHLTPAKPAAIAAAE
jgi:alkanesulfonate monooxygenase SsuD/methylene tetrahydromethanopterin reductase-like flavin-dependent oxidoreductase (luciferase family)